jgi:hypothetical protein
MKTVAKYFLFAFCMSFLLGAWQGWEERGKATDEELQTQTAIAHWEITPAKQEEKQNPSLSYVCDSIQFFAYDLSTDAQREYQHPVVESSIVSFESVERVFEAATGIKLLEIGGRAITKGGKAESIAELLKEERVALIVGSLSGYFAGHAVAARTRPDCVSSGLLIKLRDKNSPLSVRVRREYFRQWISFLCVNVDGDRQRIMDEAPRLRGMLDNEYQQMRKLPKGREEIVRSIPVLDFHRLEEYWDKFSDTSYNPSGKDFLELASTSHSLIDIVEYEPDILKKAYPNAKNIKLEYFAPVDFGDGKSTSEGKKTSFVSSNLMLLTVGGCFVVLGVLGVGVLVGYFRDKRKAAGGTVGFATEENRASVATKTASES